MHASHCILYNLLTLKPLMHLFSAPLLDGDPHKSITLTWHRTLESPWMKNQSKGVSGRKKWGFTPGQPKHTTLHTKVRARLSSIFNPSLFLINSKLASDSMTDEPAIVNVKRNGLSTQYLAVSHCIWDLRFMEEYGRFDEHYSPGTKGTLMYCQMRQAPC